MSNRGFPEFTPEPGQPPDPDRLLHLAASLQRRGDLAGALAAVEKLLEFRPQSPIAHNFRGNLLLGLGRITDAIASYDHALLQRPDYPEAINNRAVAFAAQGRHAEAANEFARLAELKPGDSGTLQSLGICLAAQAKHSDAIAAFSRAIAVERQSAELYRRRGQSLQQLQRTAEALADFAQAIALSADPESLVCRGMLLLSLGRDPEALADFSKALTSSPNDPGAGLGSGIALLKLNRIAEAITAYDRLLQLQPDSTHALYNRATALVRLMRFDEAARDCEALLRIDPEYPYGLGLLLHCRLYACDWRNLTDLRSSAERAIATGKKAIHPLLQLAISDSPAPNLHCARIYAGDLYPASPQPLWRGEKYGHDRIRIAYLSADFYHHATAFLMAGVFEHHDRRRFETTAISYGPDDDSAMRRRLVAGFDRFIDMRAHTDREIAEQLRALEVDIAVDLKGYTGDARPGILRHRAAPVQVHYLGYPGSLGAAYIDYLIADEFIVPEHMRDAYAEQVVWLPGCYQCNDDRRADPPAPSRAAAGLPQTGFVFCCFNSNFKLSPEMLDIWSRLLNAIPDSMLWLLAANPDAAENLRREATNRGIAPERLIFAPRVPLEQHLARLKLADLALDTFPYGAHTTASDAMWSGVPLLALCGESFAARVAASILTAAGVPELVCGSVQEYEALAIALARDSDRLRAILSKLRSAHQSPLFDTPRFTRHLESAFATMYERQQNGLPPAGFAVKAIHA